LALHIFDALIVCVRDAGRSGEISTFITTASTVIATPSIVPAAAALARAEILLLSRSCGACAESKAVAAKDGLLAIWTEGNLAGFAAL
jgi:hypothetical protein